MQSRRPQLLLTSMSTAVQLPDTSTSNTSFNIEAVMLHEFIAQHRQDIIRRCQSKVATRSVPPPTASEMTNGVPLFLDQLTDALRLGALSSPEIGRSAIQHGHDLRRQGFTVSQVVHDYGDVCQSVTELAMEMRAPISADDFRLLNACLDDAIAVAVTEFAREGNQSATDAETTRGRERLGFFAHELRNLLNTAMLAFGVLKSGNVGVGGSTGTVLYRSLGCAVALINRSLAEVRLTQGVRNLEPILVDEFIDELSEAATLAALSRSIVLTVEPVETGWVVEGDRQVLTAVLMNLLLNAVKFTRPGTQVVLRVGASAERVLLEIEDRCGGLPGGNVEDLFRPYEQRGADRTGLGLGLAFSRWGVEASRGRVYARNLPGVGCVFTVDLPRVPAAALSVA
jgi:signal transduction histidine kinase